MIVTRNIIKVILGVVGPEVLFGIRGRSVKGVVRRIVRIITIAIVTTTTSWHQSVRTFVANRGHHHQGLLETEVRPETALAVMELKVTMEHATMLVRLMVRLVGSS